MRSAHRSARFWEHDGHSPLALHENGTIRSVFEEQSGFVHASLRKPKCGSPQRKRP
jgi:hypothetical protein